MSTQKRIGLCALLCLLPLGVSAQTLNRLQGRVVTDRGEPVPNADVRVEAFYGYAAGTFAGQRVLTASTDRKGAWNVLGIQSGIWLVEVTAPGCFPESVALLIHLLTTPSAMQSGMALNWQLVLKPVPRPTDDRSPALVAGQLPVDATADELAGAGRVALQARDMRVARALFQKALERDPASFRAALGIATTFLLARDFDAASKVFDAARNRTHDKDEIRFITIALGDLATIKVR